MAAIYQVSFTALIDLKSSHKRQLLAAGAPTAPRWQTDKVNEYLANTGHLAVTEPDISLRG